MLNLRYQKIQQSNQLVQGLLLLIQNLCIDYLNEVHQYTEGKNHSLAIAEFYEESFAPVNVMKGV